MSLQTTLITSHKGVDLHAATALRVMQRRLDGGDRLAGLFRCEMHTFWGEAFPGGADRLLETGRCFNPNKHHFGVFAAAGDEGPWFQGTGHDLAAAWPGDPLRSDLPPDPGLYDRLLGGAAATGTVAVDVISFPRGETGPVLGGVLWRLVLAAEPGEAAALAESLAVARHRKEGLLLNPHMEDWLLAVR
ncbi:hypothetical protein KJ682_09775 [bacterium]|nr:hypothetical protein [bacterium]